MRIANVAFALPENYYSQEELSSALKRHWEGKLFNLDRLEQLHRNVLVSGRHLAIPLEEYDSLSFQEANDAYIRTAPELGERALTAALSGAGLDAKDVDHIFFVSTTGIATPSVDALIVNRMGLRPDVKRSPLFGLGCAAGAVGVTRAADYVRGFPDQVAVVLSVELCSLTLQRSDLSIPNLIASGLFGDGAAVAVVTGAERGERGPKVIASRSTFYPDTERVMGWDVTDDGLRVVLSADIPDLVRREVRANVEGFLGKFDLGLSDISTFLCHPGGPRVLEAFQQTLELPPDALRFTWESLSRYGNLSSASVLFVFAKTLEERTPEPGSYGLLMALGPGFASELVLLSW